MKKWFVFIIVSFAFFAEMQAQIDTEFWFAAPDLEQEHSQEPIKFCISSFENAATITFEQPANPSYTPMTFNLSANSFCVYDVSDIINIVETQPYNTVLNYGFHVYSTAPVSIYYESDNQNSEIYSLKGTNALGTSFVVPMQYTYDNNYTSTCSRIEVVATENETSVTFIPSQPIKGGGQPGVPVTVVLNCGQSYAIEASSPSAANHLRNTVVTSNKPIAVNTSDDSVYLNGDFDLIGDQIVPIDLVGTEYIALWHSNSNEHLYFFPTQDNTSIYLNGSQTPIAILDEGQEYAYTLNSMATYVHSDKPIVVFQQTIDGTRSGYELGGTMLPHISCTGSRTAVYKRNGTDEITITLVVKASCINSFVINGNDNYLTYNDFNTVPSNTDYKYCIKNVSDYIPYDGLMKIENTHEDGYFQLGVFSIMDGTCSYGYFSDYHEYAYAEFNMFNTYCVGDNITFNYEEENVENLTLILPNGTTMTQSPFVLTNVQTSQSGTYQLQGESCNGIQILDEIYITIEDCFIPDIPLPDNIDSANCVFFPTATEWGIEVGWSSNNIVSNLNSPLVGDLDNDGHPEIICFSKNGDTPYGPNTNDQMLVFDGVTKQLKTTIVLSSPVTAYDAAAYGMVKLPSGKGLIVTACYDYKLRAYDITAANPNTPFWTSNVDYGSNYGDWGVNVGFADFNHDGHPEVYVRNKIYNAETGSLLVSLQGSENVGASYCHYTHVTNWKLSSPMAADMCSDSRLELILGNEIYDVNITNTNGTSGNTITLARQIAPPNGVPTDGNTQVADFNADGYLDVFISIRNTSGYNGTVYCYVWDVHNNVVSSPLTINTWFSGKSIPMIADIDNDGLMEILIQCDVSSSYEKFQAYKYHSNTLSFTYLWGFATDEDSYSNSITSFDFNQDGLLELMICDQSTVRIVNGSGYSHITGNDTIPVYVMSSFPFSEITIMQYPIIVDVDDDGNAEIVSVGSDKLNFFESAGEPWAPARKVWNQYMYNVTNINNDLTVPQYLFNNATSFTDPQGVVRRPFNNFLQQATTIDQYGRPFYAVPDVAALAVNVNTSGNNAMLNVTYTNQGDNTLNAPYYITVFANQFGGQVVQTITVSTPLPVGGTGQQSISLPMSVLCQLENVSSLVVAINCNGGGIAQDGNLQPECDITNNTEQVSINLQSEPTIITEIACDQYAWYGQTYTQSGQYETTVPNTFGCDSTLVLNLTINHSDSVDYTVTACENYEWNGQTYSQSGDYTYNSTNEFGCDRLEFLHLTISSGFRQKEVSECDGYFWTQNQQWYNQSVMDSVVVPGSIQGCDSTFVLNLTLHYSDTLVLEPITVCDSYDWHGETYTECGILTYQTTNEFGCERLETLELTVSGNETIELEPITECDEYVWHGLSYFESGTYTFDTLNQYGCTLQYILPLTINHSDTVNYNITACESYEWNGQTYSQSGNYTNTTTNELGCERLEILALTISDSYRQEDVVSDCDDYFWPITQQWYYESTVDSIVNQGSQGACDSTFVLNLTLHYSDTLGLDPVTACNAYEWHGVTYTESGLQTYQTTNEYGCPRIEYLDLTISENETIELPAITECDAYTWYGTTYSESGNYTYDTLNQYGCLLQYVLPLTINHSDTLDWEPVTACDSYLWNGQTITETGDYSINTINGEGCNRLERIHVNINYNTFDTVAPVTACDSYVWHDTPYTQSGVYSYETEDPWGCLHTEILFLTIRHGSLNEFNVTSCEPYEWFGTVYEEPGTYTHTLTNSQGCDSLLIMHLGIGEVFVSEVSAVGCGEYEWHGNVYTQSGDFQYDIESPVGCDSIFILHLTIAPTYEEEIEAETCYSYTWITDVYTESGDYEHHFNSAMGCDSLVTLHLTINDAIHYEFEQQTCTPYTWNGISYYVEGNYEQNFEASNGCDSIVTMHLTFNEQFNKDISVNTCEDVYTWNGVDYFTSGVYQQTFLSTAGCDSIVNLYLTFVDSFVLNIDTTSCEPIQWDDDLLEASGVYSYAYISSSGCDSIVNLNLNIAESYEVDAEATSCGPYQWGNASLAESGYYQHLFITSNGCDSIVNLHLVIVDSYEIEIDTTTCGFYQFGNETLYESGIYQYQFLSSNGCDSLVNLRLTVDTDETLSIQGATSIFPSTDLILGVYPYYIDSTRINPANVRWSIDRDDWLLVPHGANCELVCTSIGQGILRVRTEGETCEIDTTLVINAAFFDAGEKESSPLSVFPNPTQGMVTIVWKDMTSVCVLDMYGRQLERHECEGQDEYVLYMSRYPDAVYLLEVVSQYGTAYKLVFKSR